MILFYRFRAPPGDSANSVIYSSDQLEGLDIQFYDPQEPLPTHIIENAVRLGTVEQVWPAKLTLELLKLRTPELGLLATMSPGYKDKHSILDDIHRQQNK